MKKIFLLLSAFIFLFGGAGYYLAFTVMDCGVKNEIGLSVHSPSPLQLIKLSFSKKELLNEVRFTSPGQNEFIYKGERYDVVKINKDDDQITFICITDKKETALFAHFNNKVNEESSANNSGKTTVKSVMQDWFFQNYSSGIYHEAFELTSSNEVLFLCNSSFEIPSPPPKC